jgi:hypothetical protein
MPDTTPHEWTAKNAELAKELSGYGLAQEKIATLIGIDAKTLRKYYRKELDLGIAEAHRQVGKSIKERTAEDTTLAIFYAKTQMGWKENITHQIEMPNTVLQILGRGNDDGGSDTDN